MDDDRSISAPLSRRRFLSVAATAVAGGAVLGACGDSGTAATGGGSGAAGGTFTIANWGGVTSRAMVEAWGGPFTERTGAKVVAVSPMDYGKLTTQIRTGEVTWDWADVEGWFPPGNRDLLHDVDAAAVGVTAEEMVAPELLRPYAVASYLNSYVIAYRSDRDGAKPSSWAELFDVDAFPGKRSLYNYAYGMLEVALLADGVPFADLYPLDVDRAFAKLDTIRKDVVFWNTGAEAQQLLVSGNVDYIVPWSSRACYLALKGEPIAIEWNGNLRISDYHIIPDGVKDPRRCAEFIAAALDPQAQADFARLSGGLAPTTKRGSELVDDELKPYLSTTPENWERAAGGLDDDWWAENLAAVSTKWTAFVGG